MANHGNSIQRESMYTHGSWRTGGQAVQKRQVEIDEMVIETSQRFFQSFSSAFG